MIKRKLVGACFGEFSEESGFDQPTTRGLSDWTFKLVISYHLQMVEQDSVSKEMSKRGFSSKSAEWSRSKKFSELKIDVNFVPLKNQMRKSHEPAGGAKKPRQLVTSQQPPIRSTNVKWTVKTRSCAHPPIRSPVSCIYSSFLSNRYNCIGWYLLRQIWNDIENI